MAFVNIYHTQFDPMFLDAFVCVSVTALW